MQAHHEEKRRGFNRSMRCTNVCVAEGGVQMKRRPRICYTESQKALMWERWRKGESLQQIAQLFDRNYSSIERTLTETGAILPPQ